MKLELIFSVVLICLCGQNLAKDYDFSDMMKIFAEMRTLTFGRLFDKELTVPIRDDVKFFCATPGSPNLVQVYINESLGPLNLSLHTSFLVHGWIDHVNRTWVQETVQDHLKFRNENICAVDWSRMANYFYPMSVVYTQKVGAYIGEYIKYLVSKGGSLDKMVIVGHSLGGQIAGFAGAALNGRLGRIIALDPAGPLYTIPVDKGPKARLDPTDAVDVQVIHTSNGLLGVMQPCGKVDFYPNSGYAPQSGCLFDTLRGNGPEAITCSHLRACEFFRYSLNPANKFIGQPCPNMFMYDIGYCSIASLGPTDVMGYNSVGKGTYYLRTYFQKPFALSH